MSDDGEARPSRLAPAARRFGLGRLCDGDRLGAAKEDLEELGAGAGAGSRAEHGADDSLFPAKYDDLRLDIRGVGLD